MQDYLQQKLQGNKAISNCTVHKMNSYQILILLSKYQILTYIRQNEYLLQPYWWDFYHFSVPTTLAGFSSLFPYFYWFWKML